jgi:hypothetical protein
MEALKIYKVCVGSLYDSLHGIPESDSRRRASCASVLEQYMERAETLKIALDSSSKKGSGGGGGGGGGSGGRKR